MTTIVGIKAYGKKERAIVMAADLQATREFYRSGGDTLYRVQEKETYKKLMVGDQREIVLAISGTVDTPYTNRFIRKLLHPREGEKINLEKKLKKRFLKEFWDMNVENCTDKNNGFFNDKKQSSALIATRFGETPELYYIKPVGVIHDGKTPDMPEDFYIPIGSGAEYAGQFLRRELKNVGSVDIDTAIDLATQAVKEATETDIYSAGTDLVVVTPSEILEFGDNIREATQKAVEAEIGKIKKLLGAKI